MDLSQFARYPSLKDKTVLVTGGGSGIGAAIVECFLDQGSRIAYLDINAEASEKLNQELAAQYGGKPVFLPCDLRDIAALRASIDRISSELGDIAVLVNNAANDQRHKWREVTPEYWDERMATNLRHFFFAIQ